MFDWLINFFRRKHTVRKIVIRKKGRDEWIYREGDRKMVIYAELGVDDVEIDFGSIWRWLPPHNEKALSFDERDKILKDFCSYLDSRKIKHTVRKLTGSS